MEYVGEMEIKLIIFHLSSFFLFEINCVDGIMEGIRLFEHPTTIFSHSTFSSYFEACHDQPPSSSSHKSSKSKSSSYPWNENEKKEDGRTTKKKKKKSQQQPPSYPPPFFHIHSPPPDPIGWYDDLVDEMVDGKRQKLNFILIDFFFFSFNRFMWNLWRIYLFWFKQERWMNKLLSSQSQLSCVVFLGGILECDDCSLNYHLHCHTPHLFDHVEGFYEWYMMKIKLIWWLIIKEEEIESQFKRISEIIGDDFICFTCQEKKKKIENQPSSTTPTLNNKKINHHQLLSSNYLSPILSSHSSQFSSHQPPSSQPPPVQVRNFETKLNWKNWSRFYFYLILSLSCH